MTVSDLSYKPNDDELIRAQQHLAMGGIVAARAAAEALVARDPTYLAARLLANQAAFMAGDYVGAMHHIELGLSQDPARGDLHLRKARCLIVWNKLTEARSSLTEASEQAGADAALWGMIGDAYTLLNDFDHALAAYNESIIRDPQPAHYFNRAVVARYVGDQTLARADYCKAIALRPLHGETYLNFVHLGRQTSDNNMNAQMETLKPRLAGQGRDLVNLLYALAKSYEDIGESTQNFVNLNAGARLVRGAYRYDVRQDVAQINLIKANITAESHAGLATGHSAISPIFVLGLPRSGSTVIERILTSHSDVGAIGESQAFAQALTQRAQVEARVAAHDGAGIIKASAELNPAALGAEYEHLTSPWAGSEPRFVDKLPNNHLYVGLIAQALPSASIVHITRHPMANLYGMYKTLFNQAYPYSYDLDELVAYYIAYRGLMAHWRSVLGKRLIEVSYEALIEAPQTQIQRLIAACGLTWEDACLTFHTNTAPSTTQSATQVREPLNRRGVEGWRQFSADLAPLREKLIAAGVDEAELV